MTKKILKSPSQPFPHIPSVQPQVCDPDLSCLPPPVSSAVILTGAGGGNEVAVVFNVETAYLLADFSRHVTMTKKIQICPSQPVPYKPHCVSAQPQVRDPELPAPAGLLGRHPDSGCRRQRGGRRLQLGPRQRPRHLRHSLPTPQPGGSFSHK